MLRRTSRHLPLVLAGAALFLATETVHAQSRSGSVGGGLTGSSGSSVGGGLTGSSSPGGGLTGSSSSSPAGGFTGSTSSANRGGANSSSTTPGATSVLGTKLGSALSTAYPGSAVAASYGSTTPTYWYNTDIPFGTAMYTIPASTLNNTGFASAGLSNSSSITVATGRYGGANSYGVRRTPSYTTGIAFDYSPRPAATVRPDLEQILNTSTRLPSRGNLSVLMDGNTVVLRGRVATARERRLVEAIVRLTPGVRDVRNEIEAPQPTARSGP